MFGGLFSGWDLSWQALLAGFAGRGLDLTVFVVSAAGILLVEAVERCGPVAEWIRRRWFFVRWPLYYLLAAALLFFGAFGKSAFIYQNY